MKILFTLALLVTCIILEGQSPQVQELVKLYLSGQYNQTIRKANEYLLTDPKNVDYKLTLGRALADKGAYKSAVPNLKFCVQHDVRNSWRKAWALGYLGTCFYILEENQKSEENLLSCIKLNATKNATKYARSGHGTLYEIKAGCL